ncbi:hypothetical protein ACF1G0_03880 [Streptomyces sp. NPDC013953]|uniref:hypothetical protein n=1 Tax=Streptomyces sp. NPDC013953 TaxID=3364868 RepID=UPI0037006E54
MFLDFAQLQELCTGTAAATVRAAAAATPRQLVSTQGHVLTGADLMTTLTVEATVHHLDLVRELPTPARPSAAGLAAVRATLDGLLGRRMPPAWDDEHYARAATGRVPLTAAERDLLGPDAARFLLFGRGWPGSGCATSPARSERDAPWRDAHSSAVRPSGGRDFAGTTQGTRLPNSVSRAGSGEQARPEGAADRPG